MNNLKRFIPIFFSSFIISCCTSFNLVDSVISTSGRKFLQYIKESQSQENIIAVLKSVNPIHFKDAILGTENINIRDERGFTPLMYAAGYSLSAEVIEILLDSGAQIESMNKAGMTPLLVAAAYSKIPASLNLLIERGANIYVKDINGRSVWEIINSNEYLKESSAYSYLNKIYSPDSSSEVDNTNEDSSLIQAKILFGLVNRDSVRSDIRALDLVSIVQNLTIETIEKILKLDPIIDNKLANGKSPLMLVSRFNKDPEIVKALVDYGANLKIIDQDGTPLFIYALNNSNKEVIETLIQLGADIEVRDNKGYSPLTLAVTKYKSPELVQLLIESGADIEISNQEQETVIFSAIRYNSETEIVKILLDSGASVEVVNNQNRTPLSLAASMSNNSSIINSLITAGSKVDSADAYGWTPLMYAVRDNKNASIVNLLFEAGANLEARTKRLRTPLMIAVTENRNPNVTKTLLAAGVDIEATDIDSQTALILAAGQGVNPENLFSLIDAGAEIDLTWDTGETALMYAIRTNSLEIEAQNSIILALLNAGADHSYINYRNGKTAWLLMLENLSLYDTPAFELLKSLQPINNAEDLFYLIQSSADYSDIDQAAKVLTANNLVSILERGFDANLRDKEGYTVLSYVAKNNTDPKVIEILLASAADLESRDYQYGSTPLMQASQSNLNPAIVNTLIRAGADINASDNDGWTPLMYAVRLNSNPDISLLLLENGADYRKKNIDGLNAWDLIQSNNSLHGTKIFLLLSNL